MECTPQMRDQRWGWKIETVVLTTWIPLILVVIARVIVKKKYASKFGLDDFFMLFAVIPLTIGSISHVVSARYGLGQHIACLTEAEFAGAIKCQVIGAGMNILSIWIVKVSICFFLINLIRYIHQRLTWFIWIILAINTLLNLTSLITWGVSRIPMNSWWNIHVTPTSNNEELDLKINYAAFIVNVFIDFVFALSPIYFLWDVRIDRRRKLTLWLLLLLAILPSIAGVLKVVYLSDIFDPLDPTFSAAHSEDIAAIVEQNAGTFIANLPSIKIIFDHLFDAMSNAYSGLYQRLSARFPSLTASTPQRKMYSWQGTYDNVEDPAKNIAMVESKESKGTTSSAFTDEQLAIVPPSQPEKHQSWIRQYS